MCTGRVAVRRATSTTCTSAGRSGCRSPSSGRSSLRRATDRGLLVGSHRRPGFTPPCARVRTLARGANPDPGVRGSGRRVDRERIGGFGFGLPQGVPCCVVAGPDFDTELKALDATLTSVEKVLDLPKMRAEIADLGEQVAAPDLWDDQANAQRVTSRLSSLQAEVERVARLRIRVDDLGVLIEMAREENDADTLAEAEKELADLGKAIQSLEVRTLLSGERVRVVLLAGHLD